MSILFFIFVFICTGLGKIFLQINPAAAAFINILIAGLIKYSLGTAYDMTKLWYYTDVDV